MSTRAHLIVALAVGLMLSFVPGGLSFAAPDSGSFSGKVVDGTSGASLPGGLVARLTGVTASGTAVAEPTATVGVDGRFAFENIAIDPTVSYAVLVDYGGATYSSPIAAGTDGSSPIKVTIYEPTTSDATLQIDAATWVIESLDPTNQQVTVLETLALNNASDRTFVGDHHGDPGSDAPGVLPRTLRIVLPSGASGFIAQLGVDQATTLPVANGVVDTQPILPGQHQIGYTYHIAYSEGGAEIRKALPYPTKHLRFLGPDAGLDLRSDRLAMAGTMQIQNRPYVILSGDDIPANTVVTVDIFGLPSSPVGRLDPGTIQTVGLVAIGLAIVFALYLAWRPASSPAVAETERQSLIISIARLDDDYAASKTTPDETYRAQRDRLKRQLVDQIIKNQNVSDPQNGG